ncbi:MAG: hypothetical protein MJ002_00025 [Paludibacteraceae bacterium]|nr:hypothetical protein [Paludibacteraceae bacterium]
MNSYTLKKADIHIFCVDVAIISIAMLIPFFSHLFIPLYQFNPILFLLMLSIPYYSNQWNAHILATAIPLLSFLIIGMPTLTKVYSMVIEYNVVLYVYFLLQDKMATRHISSMFVMMFFAIFVGKCAYYLSKTILLVGTMVIDTPVIIQSISSIVIALISSVFAKFKNR